MQDMQAAEGYSVMLSPDDHEWRWTVCDLEGETRAFGWDADREAAWRSGLSAAGMIGSLDRLGR